MKCLIFTGAWFEAQDAYNKWAEGKPLTKDVIVHTNVSYRADLEIPYTQMYISVFFDETLHPSWVGK